MRTAARAEGNVFEIQQQHSDECDRVVLQGDLDMAAAPQLEGAITRLCAAGALEIELDLRELRFIDSCGVRAILAARETCAAHDVRYYLVRGESATQQRLFELTGLADVLPWREPQPKSPRG